jgi:hypothetical protein
MTKKMKWFLIIFCTVWAALHVPALLYGTESLPLHMSYVGDEQAPVNGALHILQEKNLAAFRNLKTVYYGPLFSVIALPGVAADFAGKLIMGKVDSAEAYKNFLLWDWGGIVWKLRLIALLCGVGGIVAFAKLLLTDTVNPKKILMPVYLGVSLLGLNFFYFEYTGFFRHWAFIVPLLIAQLYLLVRLRESGYKRKYWIWLFVVCVISFGISYMGILYQLAWLPLLAEWLRQRNKTQLKQFLLYVLGVICAAVLIVSWHPHAFKRIVGLVHGDVTNGNTEQYSPEKPGEGVSFGYYGSIMLNNHLSLILLFAVLAIYRARRGGIFKEWWFWAVLGLAIFLYALFGTMSHHESRYLLPVIMLFIVATSMLLIDYYSGERSRTVSLVVLVLVTYTLLFHSLHIGKWLQILSQGPEERNAISAALEYQKEHQSSKILFLQYYILGYPHTKDAYNDYMERFNKKQFNLYKTIAAAPLPKGIAPLNAYYYRPDNPISREVIAAYDAVVYKYDPAIDGSREPDFFDVDITRLWSFHDLNERYFIVK